MRVFGNVFGNTIHSASLVVAIFMLGLGAGSVIVGVWADRRYAVRPDSLLRAYGIVELLIAGLGFAIAAALPHLGEISALISLYTQEPSGWYVLSAASYVARAAIAVVLLTPITLLMGGTLTLLIRHLVRHDLAVGAWRIAVLYAVNTAGAAVGALLTDFALVPAAGLWGTQVVAIALNVAAGGGALFMTFRLPAFALRATARSRRSLGGGGKPEATGTVRRKPGAATSRKGRRGRQPALVEPALATPEPRITNHDSRIALIAVAVILSGFAAMGMEILWFRHFTMLLGSFRAVFSLLLAVILIGIGAGSLAGGFLHRRTGRAGELFMLVQGLFVAFTLAGVALADVRAR